MKMVQNGFVGDKDTVACGGGDGRGGTVVVGVKFDSSSRELLTWALVKVAQPGDCVIALHVLVDLKLKISRGSSISKILAREAKSYSATKLIVGTAAKIHKIRSSTSVAKYCAKKLTKNCSVIAVNNGKVVFHREGSPGSTFGYQGNEDQKRNSLLNVLHRMITLNKNSKVQSEGIANAENKMNSEGTKDKRFHEAFFKSGLGNLENDGKRNCTVCGSGNKFLLNDFCHQSANESICGDDANGEKCLAIVPVQKAEAASNQKEEGRDQTEFKASNFDGESSAIVPFATSNFLANNLVGRGGSSRVYKGCLRDDMELAVKILKPSDEVLKEFVLEIEIITTLHHKNIISLLGFCYEDNNLLLVYDFLSRGSLEENLHGNKKDPNEFGWNERYKVAVGVAEALDYLHTNSDHAVIHRDVKSSNILLSDDFEPQLSDFGLAKWSSTTSSHITCTDVAGTFGYLAPEYFMYDGEDGSCCRTLYRRAPRARPQMSVVVKLLQGDADVIKWARLEVNASEGCDTLDDDAYPRSNLQSHLNLALLDVEEDSVSMSSYEQSLSSEEYLKGRWSRSSSFD
ncbi:NAD(P)H-quinone oxidoreductase subunit M [Hibiscus syriacus]|uniref:non-specific serine/threonine protein kinase n=1 Tax=Hibiscus syriacus TaxID=106335 RepID=A0A6A3BQH2_HIBSY|nr:NAD(P)H-quinone oxidoreductase subunit M [Hibiscus syriacus]